jgi:hypothetical protein
VRNKEDYMNGAMPDIFIKTTAIALSFDNG